MTTLEFMRKAYHNKLGAYADAQKRKGSTEEELKNLREKISHYKKAIEALELYEDIEPDSIHSVCKSCCYCRYEEWEKGYETCFCDYDRCSAHFMTRYGCYKYDEYIEQERE